MVSKVVSLPKVMVFFIKRYKCQNGKNLKVQKRIELNPTVNFEKIISANCERHVGDIPKTIFNDELMQDCQKPRKSRKNDGQQKDTSSDYKIFSVLTHKGSSGSTGHYFSDVFRFEVGHWMNYSDSSVKKTSAEHVM